MQRYFIQVAYNGANYSGFQAQKNANSVQSEVEKALTIFFKTKFELTGSSRTDAGVHALSNYFHFDSYNELGQIDKSIYNLNAILPPDIVIKSVLPVSAKAHCRFSALSREYEYYIYQSKDPFLRDRAFYYPYQIDIGKLNEAASLIKEYTNFASFSKRNTQVKTFTCAIMESQWLINNNVISYNVKANRFLRGMVRGLVGTMLRVGTNRITIKDFKNIIEAMDCSQADFSVPPQGLFLINIHFPVGTF